MVTNMSQWRDEDAAEYMKRYAAAGEDLALRVYTSRLLGRDPGLVLHGGGNTSVKTRACDELGREEDVLCVKGSGWDLAQIEPPGLPAVCLGPLLELRKLSALSDEAMVNGIRRNLLDTSAPNPSVETLLHAFLPHKFIDHTHADAVLAVVDQPRAQAICREIYGDTMAFVPYIRPGFLLAKAAAEIYEANSGVEGLILVHHGIFSFGPDARTSYDRMIANVTKAREYIEATGEQAGRSQVWSLNPKATEEQTAACAGALRGALAVHVEGIGPMILRRRISPQIDTFLAHPKLTEIATRGSATPDHVIRTKKNPLFLLDLPLDDEPALKAGIADRIQAYTAAYHRYFALHNAAKGGDKRELHPLPLVFLIPGMGLITAGKTAKDADIAADIYEHTIQVILDAEKIGTYDPLPEDDLFDMEYWSLEQAKLGKKKYRPLEGRIGLVTGAAGGIGQALAHQFASEGCHLVLTDLDGASLDTLIADLKRKYGAVATGYAGEITSESFAQMLVDRACLDFGGLDLVISNAGRAFTCEQAESTVALRESLEINLMAHQYLAAAAVKRFRLQGAGGCLLFNASKSAFNPGPGFGPYSIAKAALVALMKQYAIEYAADGIRAMAINADRIRTGIFDHNLLETRARARGLTADDYFRANLLGREVLAEDVARGFYHLYLSQASTGTVLTVDGGNIAASPR